MELRPAEGWPQAVSLASVSLSTGNYEEFELLKPLDSFVSTRATSGSECVPLIPNDFTLIRCIYEDSGWLEKIIKGSASHHPFAANVRTMTAPERIAAKAYEKQVVAQSPVAFEAKQHPYYCEEKEEQPVLQISSQEYIDRIQKMYELYAPEKLLSLQAILAKYVGVEFQLLSALKRKYGPEPTSCNPESLSLTHLKATPVHCSAHVNLVPTELFDAQLQFEADSYASLQHSMLAALLHPLANITDIHNYVPLESDHSTQNDRRLPEHPKTVFWDDDDPNDPTDRPQAIAEGVRERIQRLYKKYAPDMLPKMDTALLKYKGREEQMISKLIKKYGPEPTPPATPEPQIVIAPIEEMTYRKRAQRLLAVFDPELLPEVDTLLEQYEGREEKMLSKLIKKYGPEPECEVNIQIEVEKQDEVPKQAIDDSPSTSLRKRIELIYATYAPEKLEEIDLTLSKYEGNEEKLMSKLVKKYGPEPTGTEARKPSDEQTEQVKPKADPSEERTEYRTRVLRLYSVYAPDMIKEVDTILDKYVGKYEKMMSKLVKKYGEEPTDEELQALLEQNQEDEEQMDREFYQQQLQRLFAAYAPERVAEIDALLDKSEGKEEKMMKKLIKKYGPVPTAEDANQDVETLYRIRLKKLFTTYAEDQIVEIDDIMKKFQGKWDKMMKKYVKKYGPEPDTIEPVEFGPYLPTELEMCIHQSPQRLHDEPTEDDLLPLQELAFVTIDSRDYRNSSSPENVDQLTTCTLGDFGGKELPCTTFDSNEGVVFENVHSFVKTLVNKKASMCL